MKENLLTPVCFPGQLCRQFGESADVSSGQARRTTRAQVMMELAAAGANASAHAATQAQASMILTAQASMILTAQARNPPSARELGRMSGAAFVETATELIYAAWGRLWANIRPITALLIFFIV